MMQSFTPDEERQKADRSRRMMTRLLVFAIVMFFAALTSACLVSMNSTDYWMSFNVPKAFFISTAIIVASSGTMQLALWSAQHGKAKLIVPMLAITLLLGGAFTYFQLKGWSELADRKLNFISKVLLAQGDQGKDFTISYKGVPMVLAEGNYYAADDAAMQYPLNSEMSEFKNMASAYFHVLTRAHYAHIAFGLLSLVIMLIMGIKGRYSPTATTGLWAGATYWHFLGGLWVYLLLFLHFVH